MSQLFNAVKQNDTIPDSSKFTSAEFDASGFTMMRMDVRVLSRTSGSIKFQAWVSAKAGGDYTLLKETSAISATGAQTPLTLNARANSGDVLGWVKIVAETAAGSGAGMSAIADALFM